MTDTIFTDIFGVKYKRNPNLININKPYNFPEDMKNFIMSELLKIKVFTEAENWLLKPAYMHLKNNEEYLLSTELQFCLKVLLQNREQSMSSKNKKMYQKCISRLQDLLNPASIRWNYENNKL